MSLIIRSSNSKFDIWTTTWCKVSSDKYWLLIYKSREDANNNEEPLNRINLENLSGVYSINENTFFIKCPHKVVFSSSKNKIAEWIELFKSIQMRPTQQELQKQKELEKQRELKIQKELELEKQRELEEQRKLEKQRELEKQKELERLKKEKLDKMKNRIKYQPKSRTKQEVTKLEKVSIEKKEFHSKNYISVSKLNSKEFIEKKEKAEKITNDILSKPCTGDPSSKDTLLHVLSGFSALQGKKCMFTNDTDNKNSKFIGSMGSTENQNCVLTLNDLSDVVIDEEEVKTDTKETKLKKQIIDIREDLKNNKKNKIVDSLKIKLGKAHGVDPKYIRINDVYYGSATIDYSIITSFNKRGSVSAFTGALQNQFTSYKDAKLHPLFFEESFNLSDFDDRGHKNFATGSKFSVGKIGNNKNGYKPEYIQPTGWTRYGLKVLDKRYGATDDGKWLAPFQDPKNWYRAYHGTKADIGKLIVNGPNNNQNEALFIPGVGQGYLGADNLNELSGFGKVKKGVYCSPDPKEAEAYCRTVVTIQTTQGTKNYKFMFQVCVDPTKVQFCNGKPNYWVVPEESANVVKKSMRPYGILLKEC